MKKNKVGRPRKTVENTLRKNWEKDVYELYSQGGSDVEVAVLLGITRDLFYQWIRENPSFSDTIKKGKEMSEAWWKKQGRQVRDKDLNATLWYMNMKNRFGWTDKHDHTTKGEKIKMGVDYVSVESDTTS
jgi:hypothetical protein